MTLQDLKIGTHVRNKLSSATVLEENKGLDSFFKDSNQARQQAKKDPP
jgi:hypothetical protein